MKILLAAFGVIALILGIIGIFLPVMPTTPFVLLAAACFARSSTKMHNMLLLNRYFGDTIRNYESGKGLSRKVKIRAVSLLWFSLICSTVLSGSFAVGFILFAAGVGVTAYLLRMPTCGS